MDAAMRLPFHRPNAAHQGAGAVARAGHERSVAELVLGPAHPLVALLHQFDTAFEQAVSVTAVQAAGIVFLVGDHGFGLSLVLAAAVVQLGLGLRLASLRVSRRELCVELIIEGPRGLRLACVERECHRLLDPRKAAQLARSVQEIVETAAHQVPRVAAARPLFDVRVIRPVVPELRQIASLLRADRPSLHGVAAVERLLTSPATPLYGSEVESLRQELWQARYLLSVDR
jgi:hypothetical protein